MGENVQTELSINAKKEENGEKSLGFQKYPKTCGRSVNDTVNN